MRKNNKKFKLLFLVVVLLTLDPLLAFSKVNEERGVEFVERQILIKKESLKSFAGALVESHFNPETNINELRFHLSPSLQSSSKRKNSIHFILRQKDGQTVQELFDKKADGFFEKIKRKVEGKDYIYEELIAFGPINFHNIRRRYYKIEDQKKYHVVIENRNSAKEAFVKKSQRMSHAIQFAGLQTQRQCMDSRFFFMDNSLVNHINDIVNYYDLDWPGYDDMEVSVMAEFEKSCDREVRAFTGQNIPMDRLYEEAINEGMQCLQRLSAESEHVNALAKTLYINAAGALAGQQVLEYPMSDEAMSGRAGGLPRRAPRSDYENQKVLCGQSRREFTRNSNRGRDEGIGMASTRVGQTTNVRCNGHDLKVKHPFISINFAKLQSEANRYPKRDRIRKVKETIFHEFLHTTGLEHNFHSDPVNLCAVYCFNGAMNAQAHESARQGCQGDGHSDLDMESLTERVESQVNYNNFSGIPNNFELMGQELIQMVPANQANQIMRLMER